MFSVVQYYSKYDIAMYVVWYCSFNFFPCEGKIGWVTKRSRNDMFEYLIYDVSMRVVFFNVLRKTSVLLCIWVAFEHFLMIPCIFTKFFKIYPYIIHYWCDKLPKVISYKIKFIWIFFKSNTIQYLKKVLHTLFIHNLIYTGKYPQRFSPTYILSLSCKIFHKNLIKA